MSSEKRTIRSNGKLLIGGEYLVLFGAHALAVPTTFGHELVVVSSANPIDGFSWSTKVRGKTVLTAQFDNRGQLLQSSNPELTKNLEGLFKTIAEKSDPAAFQLVQSFQSQLEFPMEWGLGSSSTLTHALATWAHMDPFHLQDKAFGGSGYDIACAGNNHPIIFNLDQGKPNWREVDFNPPFKEALFFIYLNQKQNSRKAIAGLKEKKLPSQEQLNAVNAISKSMTEASGIEEFAQLMVAHEALIGQYLGKTPVKESLFPDYPKAIKSLGAWGGDFILAEGNANDMDYFKNKGYDLCMTYDQMVLNLK